MTLDFGSFFLILLRLLNRCNSLRQAYLSRATKQLMPTPRGRRPPPTQELLGSICRSERSASNISRSIQRLGFKSSKVSSNVNPTMRLYSLRVISGMLTDDRSFADSDTFLDVCFGDSERALHIKRPMRDSLCSDLLVCNATASDLLVCNPETNCSGGCCMIS